MGTNYFLRKTKPRLVYDEYHIAKQSAGWRIHFQDSEVYRFGEDSPSYHSVDDIRRLLESGDYELADEYGRTWGKLSVAEFDELCKWNGGARYDGKSPSSYPDGEPPWEHDPYRGGYRDPQGFVFESEEFS